MREVGLPRIQAGLGAGPTLGEWQSAGPVQALPLLPQVDYKQRTDQESSGTAANNVRHLRAAGHAAKYFR